MKLLAVPVALVLALVPAVAGTFTVTLCTQALIWAILGLSVWLLLRVLGEASFGHAAFFGVGAYVAGLAVVRWDIGNVLVALALGVLIACAVALPIAIVSGRLRGVAFLMITLAFAEMLRALSGRWQVLGGSDGLVGVTRPGAPFELFAPGAFYYFVLAVGALVLAALAAFVRSPVGDVLKGIREGESRMAALGYNATAYRVLAFVVSAAIAGVAGVLNAYLHRFVDPGDVGALVSAKALLIVVLGGASILGPLAGAFALTGLEEVLSSHSERWLGLLGLIYVLVAVAAPAPGAWRLWFPRLVRP